MGAEKLTDKTELNATPADGDLVHIVDVSDTTGSSAGTSKKITVSNLLSDAGGGGGANNFCHAFAFYDSQARNVYVPFTNESEQLSLQRYNKFVCPVALKVKKISILFTTSLTGGNGGAVQTGRVTGSSFTVSETETFSSTSSGVVQTFTFDGSSYAAGDVIAIKLNNGFSSGYFNITGTIFFEVT